MLQRENVEQIRRQGHPGMMIFWLVYQEDKCLVAQLWSLVFTSTRTRLKKNCLFKCNQAAYLTAKGREEPVFASDWMVWRLWGIVFADSDADYESGGFDYHKSIDVLDRW